MTEARIADAPSAGRNPAESALCRRSWTANPHVPGPFAIAAVAALMNALLAGLIFLTAEPAYATNDGVGMMRIASGMMTGKPSEYLVYTNVLIGRVLKYLYQANRDVNWYSVYLYGTHFAAMTGLLFALLWHRFSVLAVAAYLLIFFGLDCRLLIETQFTSVAIVAATCGAILLLCAEDRDGRRSYVGPAAGILLIVLSAMIRKESFYLSLLIAAPLVFCEAWRRRSWRIIACFLAAAALGYGAIRYDQDVYARDPQWKEYMEYNLVRARLQRFPIVNYAADPQFFEHIGWSPNDVLMFNIWFNADYDTYSKQTLTQILDRFGRGSLNRAKWYPFLIDQLRQIAPFLSYTAFVLLLAWYLASGNRPPFLCAALVLLLPAAGTLVYLAVVGRLPERISLPILCFMNAGFLCTAVAMRDERSAISQRNRSGFFGHTVEMKCLVVLEAQPRGPRAARGGNRVGFIRLGGPVSAYELIVFALSVAFVVTTYGVARDLWYVNAENRRAHHQWDLLIESLEAWKSSLGGDALIVARGGAFPFQRLSPFSRGKEVERITLIPMGWATHSPLYQALLQKHRIDDPHRALFERDNVYLMCFDVDPPVFVTFIREHYGVDVQATTVSTFGDSILVRIEPSAEE